MAARVQWISPAPPLRSGIANYTADLFAAVDGLWEISAVLEQGSELRHYRTISRVDGKRVDPHLPTVIHLGNSEFHDLAYAIAREMPAVLVLHDVFLHHARAAIAVRSGQTRRYWRELDDEYGAAGVAAGRALFAGQEPPEIADFPLFEPFVRAARITVVHSEYAAREVRRRVPEADVRVVPMGIPMPATLGRDPARRALGIGATAFAIGSITHVNPNKRIPVLLRALRRLVVDVPGALLLLAGTGSDGNLLRREIEILGLQDHVRQLGYVDDATARTIASAVDACVNLRHPSTGETSASLLRLLGTGLPVLFSDSGSSAELPEGVGLKIPVDAYEVEVLASVLRTLAEEPGLREDAGVAALEFVTQNHSMVNMVGGYRTALEDAFGLRMPGLDAIPHEAPINVLVMSELPRPVGPGIAQVAGAIAGLGLAGRDVALDAAGSAVVELGLDRTTRPVDGDPSGSLWRRVACPQCGATIDPDGVCTRCGSNVRRSGRSIDLR